MKKALYSTYLIFVKIALGQNRPKSRILGAKTFTTAGGGGGD